MIGASSFRTVLRGYEPAQVDERVGELVQELHASTERAAELGREVEALQRELAERRAAGGGVTPGAGDFTALGARIGQVLTLAEQEAAHLVESAGAEADAARRDAERAAADLERDLATRRERAEAEEALRADAAAEQLAAAEQAAAQARSRHEEELVQATARARSVLQDAQEHADRLVAEAQEQADRVRAESERELSAAAQRRDSINASLTHVRQVLATLTGSVPVVAPVVAPGADVVDLRPAREDAARAG